MAIFKYKDEEALGIVLSVDTATVIIKVADLDKLRRMQVNRLVVLQSSKPGQHLIGLVQKITRSSAEQEQTGQKEADEVEMPALPPQLNLVRASLIGTLIDRVGTKENVFRRTLETVPEIDAKCFAVEGNVLTSFMRVIANVPGEGQKLSLGHYTLDESAEAYLNGNKFFQRHAIIVGSTGSGKSWTTARVLEQAASLPSVNSLVFDIHGEYMPLTGDGIKHYRVAGTGDLVNKKGFADGILYLPYWLLDYEALISMFVDRSDQNAPNQAMIIARTVVQMKKRFLEENHQKELLDNFTIDSPVPFSMDALLDELNRLNVEMVPGARSEKQGDFYGKLSRMIARLENKRTDRRLGFLFQSPRESGQLSWLDDLSRILLAGTSQQLDKKGGIKIIDFSEVPSDILPLIVSLIGRLSFSLQQWMIPEKRHPIALFCDEAHLYIPERAEGDAANEVSIRIFEKIAKEGRKYGVGLVVISQRPSEVNHTVLSQCNNLVTMRLTNAEDQSVIRRLLPDSLGGFSDVLPILDTGEALVVGDASLLPSRVRIQEPKAKPNSGTVDFWDKWLERECKEGISEAVNAWRKQNLQ
ncbi:MAG TPA: ATP-binding protein [Candidatus Wunengus sp. YC60]|uniref:ATP-binding protein n=1 Tax=Candidatus Wunengus sp. YC60 TaxID=3367697 RepID=UPI0040291BC8